MTILTSASAALEHDTLQGCLPARTADNPCVLDDDLRVVLSLGPTVTVKGHLWCKNLVLGLRRSLHLRRRLCPHLASFRVEFLSDRGCTLLDIVSYISTASVQSSCTLLDIVSYISTASVQSSCTLLDIVSYLRLASNLIVLLHQRYFWYAHDKHLYGDYIYIYIYKYIYIYILLITSTPVISIILVSY